MQLAVNYTTAYHYAEPAQRIIQLLRVTPSSFAGQAVLDWRIDVDCDARLREGRDGYGNVTHMLYIDRPVRSLAVTIAGRVLTEDRHGIVQGLPHDLPPEIFTRVTPLTAAGPAISELADWTKKGRDSRWTSSTGWRRGSTRRCATIRKRPGSTRSPNRPSPHAMASARTSPTSSSPPRGGSDGRPATSRAICSAGTACWSRKRRTPGPKPGSRISAGPPSIALNGICTDDAYIRVACGLDYRDAAPVAGARAGGGAEDLAVEVKVSEAAPQAQAQSQN